MAQLFLSAAVFPFVNSTGQVYPGGSLTFYASGTSTLQDTYSDATLSTANANPITLGMLKQVAEHLDRPTETSYWRDAHKAAEYYDPALDFERDYLPAYRLGWEARSRFARTPFEQIRGALEERWPRAKEQSRLSWAVAAQAAHDSWQHLGETLEAASEHEVPVTSGRG